MKSEKLIGMGLGMSSAYTQDRHGRTNVLRRLEHSVMNAPHWSSQCIEKRLELTSHGFLSRVYSGSLHSLHEESYCTSEKVLDGVFEWRRNAITTISQGEEDTKCTRYPFPQQSTMQLGT